MPASADISYELKSGYPGITAIYDFPTDGKVWFYIVSKDERKLQPKVKITFISDGLRKEADEQEYYDGNKPIRLEARGWFLANGLIIPEEIKEKAAQHKSVRIQIDCAVHDENDHLITKRWPAIYVYDYDRKDWHNEP
jgi:hypothetical protein